MKIDKEWVALLDDEIIEREDERAVVASHIHKRGLTEGDVEIVAVPKPHYTMLI